MTQAATVPFQNVRTRQAANTNAAPRSPGDGRVINLRSYQFDRSSKTDRTKRPTTDETFRNAQVTYNSVENTRDIRRKARATTQKPSRPVQTQRVLPAVAPTAIENTITRAANLVGTVRRASILAPTIVPGLYAHAALAGFWVVSLIGFGLAGTGSLAVSWIPIFGETLAGFTSLPGLVIFLVGWLIAALIGCCTVCAVLAYCTMRGVRPFQTAWGLLAFIGALSLYLFPFTQWFPWYLGFAAVVTFAHK